MQTTTFFEMPVNNKNCQVNIIGNDKFEYLLYIVLCSGSAIWDYGACIKILNLCNLNYLQAVVLI